jgi:hypothetical protein
MRASSAVPVVAPCRAFIGRVLQDTRQRAALRGDDLQAQHNACKGSRYAMVS